MERNPASSLSSAWTTPAPRELAGFVGPAPGRGGSRAITRDGGRAAGGGAAGFATPAGGNLLAQARYNGRRINIDLKDADVHNVLRLLADTG
ncbi:MAG TPA: hypothetical protein VIF09_16940, partial [Polyangiaceae bacterium]